MKLDDKGLDHTLRRTGSATSMLHEPGLVQVEHIWSIGPEPGHDLDGVCLDTQYALHCAQTGLRPVSHRPSDELGRWGSAAQALGPGRPLLRLRAVLTPRVRYKVSFV